MILGNSLGWCFIPNPIFVTKSFETSRAMAVLALSIEASSIVAPVATLEAKSARSNSKFEGPVAFLFCTLIGLPSSSIIWLPSSSNR